MEKNHGVEALKKIPLNDIFLPDDEAIKKLTARTRVAFKNNFEIAKNKVDSDPELLGHLEEYKRILLKNWIDGGFSLTGVELTEIRNLFGQFTFKEFLNIFFSQIVPEFFKINRSFPREPGVIVMGYLFDFLI